MKRYCLHFLKFVQYSISNFRRVEGKVALTNVEDEGAMGSQRWFG